MSLILRPQWTSQPYGAALGRHWLRPLVRQGLIAYPMRNATEINPFTTGSVAQVPSGGGVGLEMFGTAAPSSATSAPWTIISFGVLRLPSLTGSVATMAEAPGDSTYDRSLYITSSGTIAGYIFDGAVKTATTTKTVTQGKPAIIASLSTGAVVGAYTGGDLATVATSNSGFTGYTTPEFVLGYGGAGSPVETSYWSTYYTLLLNRALDLQELVELEQNPWAIFEPRRILVPVQTTGGSFTSIGVLTATNATVAGSATHLTLHTSTGSLVSGSAVVAGAANSPHLSTGALTAQASTLAGTAAHLTLHTSSGALAAQDATISGAATTGQVASGALSAQAAVVAGSAAHLTLHTSSGALSAGSAIIVGSALHPHTSTGALSAGSATVAGAATLVSGSFDAVGSLSAQAAAVVGAATRFALHTCTGALVSDSATVSGSALHTSASGVYTYMWLRTA